MDMDEFLRQSSTVMNSSEMQAFWAHINSAAGFHLSQAERQPFETFHSYITAPEPGFITAWRSNPKQERWYQLLVNGVLGNVQNAFACVRYHQERAKTIELAARAGFDKAGVKELLGASTVAGGNTLALDFEYQAYVLAYRRCLDQFARALSAFFKNDHHSFNRLPKLLQKAKPLYAALAISEIVTRHSRNFEFVLSANGKNSVRDRIAHYEFVSAGVLNISARGFMLAGGGEELNGCVVHVLLLEVLAQRTDELFQCISETIDVLIAEAKKHDLAV